MDNANSHVTLPQRLWQKISRSYRARISFAVALLIMLFLLIGFVEMYFFARKTLVEKTHDFMRSEAISCSNNIENSITEIEDVTLSLLGNTAIQNELNRKLTEHLDKYDVYLVGEHIRENLSSYALLRAEISSVQLLATDETVYSYSKNRSYLDEDALLAHKDSIYALGGRTMWFVYDGDGETLSCARAINYLPSQTTLGIVSVNITEKHIHSLYENLISPGVGDVFLLDQDGRVISSYNGTHLGELADNTFGTLLREDRACYRVLENGDSVYVSEKLRNNWRLLMTVPAAYYLEGINALGAIFLVSAILMIAAALVIVLRLTAHLTQPVNDLARAMEDFGSGNLDAHCVVTTDDEIGMLGKTFNTVGLRRTTISYKNKTRIDRPESEQCLVKNTHQPLISQEQWEIVQEVRQHKKRTAKHMDEPNIFSGLVFCADCGKPMVLHRATTMKKLEYNFKCYTYGKKGKTACSAHHIRECDLTQIVLDDLRRVTHFARMKERQFAAHINQKNSAELRQEMNRVLRELDAMKKRSAELSKLFKRLYEDNVLGRVTDEQYRMLSGDYTDEQRMLEEQIPQKEQRLAQLQAREANVDAFIEKAKQYTAIDTLTPELLRLFIQRIEVGERETKYSRNSSQSIRIIYRDIGTVDSAMQPDEKQPKLLPPLSEVIPFPA